MVDDGKNSMVGSETVVTHSDLNEVMASLKSSVVDEVKDTLNKFLESFKPPTAPPKLVNPFSAEGVSTPPRSWLVL